jgi:2-oxoisovalerate dehydrogenase E1 component
MLDKIFLLHTYRLMYSVKVMAETYEANRGICRYVHATSRGHEAIQLATAFLLKPQDWVSPYYRDESMLLGMGWSPYDLMLQLLTKKDDSFSGGKAYYSHPNSKREDKPKIIHQSSATGMQAIPTTGIAQGVQYLEAIRNQKSEIRNPANPVVVCSLGDASITEGEVSEALQFAVLKELPIIYLVQDNEWGISVPSTEGRAMDAYEFAKGFKGLNAVRVDGTDFFASYETMSEVIDHVREHRKPWLVHAKVSLLGHHTSGVRKETYRSKEDLDRHAVNDPLPKFRTTILEIVSEEEIKNIEEEVNSSIHTQFKKAVAAEEPDASKLLEYVLCPHPLQKKKEKEVLQEIQKC